MTCEAAEITIDGTTYVRRTGDAPVKIAILQRGWVYVGRWSRDGDMCALDDASCIRVWGTTRGLPELVGGPTSKTVLDKAGHVEFHVLTMIAAIDVEESKWASAL